MTRRQPARWTRVKRLDPQDKQRIGALCDTFIAEVLKPRFLPEIRPTRFNYPVDLFGRWRGSKYGFITRYRSGWEDNKGEEFDSVWVRLDHDEECLIEPRFHIMWHRHTGQWWPHYRSVNIDEALRLIETDGILHPHI
jgi:hypothetical protein